MILFYIDTFSHISVKHLRTTNITRAIFLTLDRKLADLVEALDLEFDSRSGCTKDFRKLVFTASCLALSIKDSVKRKSTSSIVVPFGNALNETPPLCGRKIQLLYIQK